MRRIGIGFALWLALCGAAVAQNTSFSSFINSAPTLPQPGVSTDQVPIVRGSTTYKTGLVFGSVASVGLSVPPSSIFSVTGSPVTTSGTLGLLTTGTSGGIPYFSSTTQLSASAALIANELMIGGGAGIAPASLGSLGTTTTLLHGNASGIPSFGPVSLTADVSDILSGANGGTGIANTGKTLTLGAAATSLPAAPGSTQCLQMDNTGAITATGTACDTAGGSVTSVGLSVPATSIFGVTGSPVTASGTLGLTTTGTSGGIPYFSSGTQLATSGALTANAFVTGGGAGSSPNSVAITGLVLGNGASAPTAYGGTSCTNQFPRSLSAAGAATCATVANTDLANASTTVNGQTCTLGGSCTVTAAATSMTVGTTAIGSGTNTKVLFDNSGVLGEYTISGSGNVAMTTSPTFVTPSLGTPASGVATNLTGTASGLTAGTVTTNANLTGPITSTGNATAIASQTGTGSKFVVDTSPTLVTPILGVATATTINKVTFTTPATGSTLTIADGKTLTDTSGVGAVLLKGATGGGFAAAVAADLPATTLATGTSVSLTAPREYYVCTSTCTVTPPVPAAGYEFCVLNDDNVATVITLAALGSSAMYENTARTAYGTAGTGTLVSGGAVADKVCIVGRDATHYLTASSNGTWTAN